LTNGALALAAPLLPLPCAFAETFAPLFFGALDRGLEGANSRRDLRRRASLIYQSGGDGSKLRHGVQAPAIDFKLSRKLV
jgi:hypothetical protein